MLYRHRELILTYAIGFLLLGVIAPMQLSAFRMNLMGRFLCYAIVALGLDMIWGYMGMLSLGHGLYMGLGAYCMGMYLKLEALGDGLPNFMAWSDMSQLPLFWQPFDSAFFALSMVVVLPVLVASIFGFLIFRSRVSDVYFAIITQAMVLITTILIVDQQWFTGGTNGLTNFETLFGYSIQYNPFMNKVLYFVSLGVLAAVYLLCYWIKNSRFGQVMVAIRDEEQRVRLSGYNPVVFKMIVFSLSAGIAGIAGALLVPQVGIIAPGMIGVVPSIELVIMVAVGGRGTLYGAMLGALLVNWGKTLISESFPGIWTYFIGVLFVLTVVLFPEGIIGVWRYWVRPSLVGAWKWMRRRYESLTQSSGSDSPQPAGEGEDS